jgi:hypothetical protein
VEEQKGKRLLPAAKINPAAKFCKAASTRPLISICVSIKLANIIAMKKTTLHKKSERDFTQRYFSYQSLGIFPLSVLSLPIQKHSSFSLRYYLTGDQKRTQFFLSNPNSKNQTLIKLIFAKLTH